MVATLACAVAVFGGAMFFPADTRAELPVATIDTVQVAATKGDDPPPPDHDDIPVNTTHRRYALASAGLFRTSKDSGDLDRDLAGQGFTANSAIDRTNPAWKLVGGYKFTKVLGVEAGYLRMNKMSTRVDSSGGAGIVPAAARFAPLTMEGVVVEGVAAWHINPSLSLIGKAGGFLWKGKVSADGLGEQATRREDGVDFVFGGGADWHLGEQVSLRLEWERFLTLDAGDLFSAGIGVEF